MVFLAMHKVLLAFIIIFLLWLEFGLGFMILRAFAGTYF